MFRRTRILIAIGAGLALGLPSAASASSVHINGADELRFEAAAGEDNDVEIDDDGPVLTVTDTVGLTAGPGCLQVDATEAVCPLDQFDSIRAFLGDGENTVDSFQEDPIHIDGSTGSANDITSFGWDSTTVDGGPGPDEVTTGNGADHLNGNGGNDDLHGGWGIDELDGGPGHDILTPSLGSDDIHGGTGFDRVRYTSTNDPQYLSIDDVANDGLSNEHDNIRTDVERIDSGGGDDVILGSGGADVLRAGDGDDTVNGGWGADTIEGQGGRDDIKGQHDADDIDGGADDDVIDGGAGEDDLDGGTGNDTVNGSIDDDDVYGGPDNDSLLGGGGDDYVSGDAGDDNLQGSSGADELVGSSGTDTADYSAYKDPVHVDPDGAAGDDGLDQEGDSVRADVENVTGGTDNDTITGNSLANVLSGGAGDDTLLSKDGTPDTLECGIGNDTTEADAVDSLADCELPAQKPADGGAAPGDQGPAAPGAIAGLKIGPSSARLSRSRVVTLKVSCSTGGAACTGTLRLQRKVKGKARSFGSKRFNVPAGAKRKVRIKVSKRTAKSIARRPLRVTAVAGDASRKVTLKPAARRKR